MSKMLEAFEKYEASRQETLAYHGGTCNPNDFEAGYQAAIEGVKAGGVVAWMPADHDDDYLKGTPLYKLPEDEK